MISLRKVNKTYYGNAPIQALKNVCLEFDSTGFIAVMGESGSGKTTLLNAISGLDKIDSGEIIIDGQNINNFTEANFNEYRNKNLGFIFQDQNLIPHLTVIENIMLSLTIAGVSKKEQRRRAYQALKVAELRDYHVNKKPSELSGGEVQRVQIARAIINNPKIILADEPTSALDRATREQVIQLLHKLSEQCLIIMVTHSYESIAEYADRIITLKQGCVLSDEQITKNKAKKAQSNAIPLTDCKERKHKKMPVFASANLAFKNMISKSGRTVFMSFASSIGIAALVIVLAVSLGFSNRVVEARNENLKTSPIIISTDAFDKNFEKTDENAYLQNAKLTKNINIVSKHFVEEVIDKLDTNNYNFLIKNSYMDMHLVTQRKAEIANIINFQQLPPQSITNQYYDIIDEEFGGRFPHLEEYNEIMLVLDENNSVSSELLGIFGISALSPEISLQDLVARINANPMRVINNNDYYVGTESASLGITFFTPKIESVLIRDYSENEVKPALKVTGILRLKPGSKIKLLEPGFVYTQALYEHIQAINSESNIVLEQKKRFYELGQNSNAIIGKPNFNNEIDKITHLKKLGYLGEESEFGNVYSIKIYVNSLEDKQYIISQIETYNKSVTNQIYKIQYDDTANEGAKTIGNIEQTIVKVLVIFALSALAISSVLIMSIMFSAIKERVNEIGILRTMGARRVDIMRIFMTEVAVIGFISGLIGIALGTVINLTINSAFSGLIEGFSKIAEIQPWHLIGGCTISVVLAMFAGFVPSLVASLKPPIVSIRKQ